MSNLDAQTGLTAQQRSLRASIAANARWAKERDRTAATEQMRAGFLAQFESQVDPNGELDVATRQKLAENARRAHMRRLSFASSKRRRAS